jgi:hypothetical protein
MFVADHMNVRQRQFLRRAAGCAAPAPACGAAHRAAAEHGKLAGIDAHRAVLAGMIDVNHPLDILSASRSPGSRGPSIIAASAPDPSKVKERFD